MKVRSFQCPNCGGSLQIPEGKDKFFCTFCGSQVYLDDETLRIDITTRIVDEAKLKELDLKEQQRLRDEQKTKELEEKEKAKRFRWLILSSVWVLIGSIAELIAFVNLENDNVFSACMTVFVSNIFIGSPFLSITMPKSFFKSDKPPTTKTRIGFTFLLMFGGAALMSVLGGILSKIFHG